MKRLFCVLLLFIAAAPVAMADESESFHYGELSNYRESGLGETRLSHSLLFAPQFFTVSHVAGRDDTFNRRAFWGIDFLTARYELLLEHRVARNSTLIVRPTISLGWGSISVSNHELFELETLGTDVERRSDLDVDNVTGDLGIHLGYRMGSWEPYLDYRLVYGKRRQRVSTDDVLYTDPSSGVIDRVLRSERLEEEEALMHSWALGVAIHFGDEPWNYSLGMHIHPANSVEWKGVSSEVWGGGFVLRGNAMRLTDDSALALILRWDFFFPNDTVNDTHHFELGVGIRFS